MGFIAFSPNLALDRIMQLKHDLEIGQLNRVESLQIRPGGKAINLARVLSTLGAEVLAAGFLAGLNGKKFQKLFDAEGLKGQFHYLTGETRECHTILGLAGHPTEINEASFEVGIDDWNKLTNSLPAGELVISGSLPKLIESNFKELLSELNQKPIVDTSGKALLAAFEAGVKMVKPNQNELRAIASGDSVSAAKSLYKKYNVPILLSLGKDGAAYIAKDSYFVKALKIDAKNPVASGDSFLAAFLWANKQDWSIAKSLQLGVAAGMENAICGGGGQATKEGIFRHMEFLSSEKI